MLSSLRTGLTFRIMSTNAFEISLPLKTVIEKIEDFAPLKLSEKWDNTGLLIEPSEPRSIHNILLTNDLTEDVMDEAIKINTTLIISYHPPIFAGLKSITQRTWKERIVAKCLENNIAVYSPHTAWDSVKGGVNDYLCFCLPKHTVSPITEGLDPGTGSGRICILDKESPISEVIDFLKKLAGISHVHFAKARNCNEKTKIKTVAVCAGSGSSVLKGVQADLYITGEMSHHDILDAVHNGTSVLLTNHSNSERLFLNVFKGYLTEVLQNRVDILISRMDRDPLVTV